LLGAFRHQHYPFDLLINDLQIDRDLSRSPLFDVWLVLQTSEVEDHDVRAGDIYVREFEDKNSNSRYDLMFNAREYNNGIRIYINFSTDLFRKESIVKMADHFTNILSQIVADASKPLDEFHLLLDNEKAQLIIENDREHTHITTQRTDTVFDKERNVQKLVAKSRRSKL
jgi:non-ribosomal peptide synthetase component F